LGYLTDTFSLQTALLVAGIAYFVAAMLSIWPMIAKAPPKSSPKGRT
jgi:hypothetical protein